jgi:hypothetical protein
MYGTVGAVQVQIQDGALPREKRYHYPYFKQIFEIGMYRVSLLPILISAIKLCFWSFKPLYHIPEERHQHMKMF